METAALILSTPDRAREILAELAGWGIDRFSVKWDNLEWRRTPDAPREWGYDVNIYNVPNPEAFLKAALPPPTSLTADFASPARRRADVCETPPPSSAARAAPVGSPE